MLTLTCSVHAMPTGHELERWKALSQIETGDRDNATGRAGEVSRYAITPKVWRQYAGTLPLSAATNTVTANNVAELVMDARTVRFVKVHCRQPTDEEWYLLWHRPARVENPHPHELERAKRFVNLLDHKK
jgi:hypothetical protein